jgi:hypothetical protein
MMLPRESLQLLDIRNRLSISYALATSVKLGSFEVGIERTIQDSRYIPEELASFGKISLSKHEVSCKIGELYMQKSSVNLMYDILDSLYFRSILACFLINSSIGPEYLWDFEQLRYVAGSIV